MFPVGGWYAEDGIANFFDNPELVQFIHRFFAFTLLAMAGYVVVPGPERARMERASGRPLTGSTRLCSAVCPWRADDPLPGADRVSRPCTRSVLFPRRYDLRAVPFSRHRP